VYNIVLATSAVRRHACCIYGHTHLRLWYFTQRSYGADVFAPALMHRSLFISIACLLAWKSNVWHLQSNWMDFGFYPRRRLPV